MLIWILYFHYFTSTHLFVFSSLLPVHIIFIKQVYDKQILVFVCTGLFHSNHCHGKEKLLLVILSNLSALKGLMSLLRELSQLPHLCPQ